MTELIKAVKANDLEKVKQLIKSGADAHEVEGGGNIPCSKNKSYRPSYYARNTIKIAMEIEELLTEAEKKTPFYVRTDVRTAGFSS